MKVHVVTIVDVRNNGFTPKKVYTFRTREKAVAKMKEVFDTQLLEESGLKEGDEGVHGDFPDAPFIPYAYCEETYIDYFETELE